jgi:hypothetical protein
VIKNLFRGPKLRVDRQTTPFEIEQQLLPGLRALANAVGKPSGGADDHEQALRVIFEPGLDADAISPDVDIPFAHATGPNKMTASP